MISGIDPKIDYVFKCLFGQKESAPILMELLNAILEPQLESTIMELEILNPFTELKGLTDKVCIVDVKARDSMGRYFDCEMQRFEESAFSQRALYYWSRLHSEQLVSGEDYDMLGVSILVCFADFTMFPGVDDYFMTFELYNRKNNILFNLDLKVITIELPKFNCPVESIKTPLEAWVYFLKEAKHIDAERLPDTLNQPGIKQALEKLCMLSQDEIQIQLIREREKYERDERNRRNHERKLNSRLEAAEQKAEAAEQKAEAAEQKAEAAEQKGEAAEQKAEAAEQKAEAAEQKAEAAEQKAEAAEQKAEEVRLRLAKLLIGQLRCRFNLLDPDTIIQIERLPVEQIGLLAEASLDFVGVDDLQVWLEKPGTV